VSRRIEFHPEFERDVREHGEWLEGQEPGMGKQFVQAVDDAILDLVNMPERHRILFPRYRRVLIPRFSVLLPFRLHEDNIRVLGVVHGARDLERWIHERI
jgi:plasmid stabilization system protein ParE